MRPRLLQGCYKVGQKLQISPLRYFSRCIVQAGHRMTTAMNGLQQDIWISILRRMAFEDAYHLTCASRELRMLGQTESVWPAVHYVASSQQQLSFILRLAPLFEHLELMVTEFIVPEEACPAKESRLCLLRLAGTSLASRAPLLGQLAPSPCQSLLHLTLDFLQASFPNYIPSE